MFWQCSECGGLIDAVPRVFVCPECGTASSQIVAETSHDAELFGASRVLGAHGNGPGGPPSVLRGGEPCVAERDRSIGLG